MEEIFLHFHKLMEFTPLVEKRVISQWQKNTKNIQTEATKQQAL